jgi:ATP-dependent 26S proteasome regulatory subunit
MRLMQLEQNGTIIFINLVNYHFLLIMVNVRSYDSNSGGEREIQRTMLELLNQLDGFDSRGDVKVIIEICTM